MSHKAWISAARFELGVERRKKAVQDRAGQKSQKSYISPIWGEAPTQAIHQKLCRRWCHRRNHVCQVSKWNFQGLRFYRGVEFSIFLLIFEWALQPCSATVLPVIVLSKLKDFSRSQVITYAVKAVILRKRCKIETLLLQTTNRQWCMTYLIMTVPMTFVAFKFIHRLRAFSNGIFRIVVRRGVAVTSLGVLTKLLYVGPG